MGEEPHLMGNVRAIFTGALHVHSLPHLPAAAFVLFSLRARNISYFRCAEAETRHSFPMRSAGRAL